MTKFVGTGPSFYKKKYLPDRGLTKVEKHCCRIQSHGLPGYKSSMNKNKPVVMF